MKKTKNMVKDYVGAGVTLGVGGAVLGGMGQGAVAAPIMDSGAKMLGAGMTAGMGMGIMNYVNKESKKMRRK